jgi:hypothetical protein
MCRGSDGEKYADYLVFKYAGDSMSPTFKAVAEETMRLAFQGALSEELPKLQSAHPDVFIAQYQCDSEFDVIGYTQTGVKCWNLCFGDPDVSVKVLCPDGEPILTVAAAYANRRKTAEREQHRNIAKDVVAQLSQEKSILELLRRSAEENAATNQCDDDAPIRDVG